MGGMRDCRYRKTEERLLSVFFDVKYDTMRQIAKKVGIARSTLYTHHHSVMKILPDWEGYILEEYQLFLQERKRKNLKSLYFDTLVFILRYRKFFEVFLEFGDREIIIKMLDFLKPRCESLIELAKKSDKILKIYESEVVEIIFEWGKGGFSEKEIEKVLFEIMYLTETAKDRLVPIYR